MEVLSNATLLCHRGIVLNHPPDHAGGVTAGVIDGLRVFGTDFFWPAEPGAWCPPYGSIPAGIDVLIAHGPCRGYVDGGTGCATLLEHVRRVRPTLVVCGHIHECRGIARGRGADLEGVLFVNAANAKGREGARVREKGPHQPIVVEIMPRANGNANSTATGAQPQGEARVVSTD